ncbi:hypothetical protein [Nonlabens sp. Asnod3-A02]|uniref:hypothetical protein n=1 Tax=Nonlabens sp. Asnod3-A02 TaxID=3160579 RepID=UPI003870C203
MKIRYKKKYLSFSLIFGILWLIISLLGIFTKENPYWTDYAFLIISFLYLGTYFYGKRNKYLTLENGQIFVNKPFGKKINLNDIKQIKNFAGDYILKTDKTELKINTQIIDEKSLVELNNELEKLELK